jgi:hypothetical protein
MNTIDDLSPTVIDGEALYTVWQFAKIVKKSEQAIFTLIGKGNRLRKLRVRRLLGKPLIYASELTEFPFTLPGHSMEVYHYTPEGQQTEAYYPEEQSARDY